MTYVSCSTAIIAVEGAASLEVGDDSVGYVKISNEVDEEDFFEEALLVAELEDKVVALLIDKDDVDVSDDEVVDDSEDDDVGVNVDVFVVDSDEVIDAAVDVGDVDSRVA
jgi:hypothetical protein